VPAHDRKRERKGRKGGKEPSLHARHGETALRYFCPRVGRKKKKKKGGRKVGKVRSLVLVGALIFLYFYRPKNGTGRRKKRRKGGEEEDGTILDLSLASKENCTHYNHVLIRYLPSLRGGQKRKTELLPFHYIEEKVVGRRGKKEVASAFERSPPTLLKAKGEKSTVVTRRWRGITLTGFLISIS